MTLSRRRQSQLLRIVTHVAALLPLLLLGWDFWQDQLGADPIREMTLRTGKAALILLLLSLACTPLNTVFGWKQAIRLRKPLGLYAFLYAAVHFAIFIYLDYGLNWTLIQEALFEKRFALVGFAAFLLLLPLAITSTRWAMRKLGKNWKRLHRLVYLAGALAIVHYFWLVKQAYTQPVIFALILALLLLARLKPIRRRLAGWGRALRKRLRTAPFPSIFG
jgi:sulfoxide reductase heme-binding subunit YedZ